jgi:hypothetical protein
MTIAYTGPSIACLPLFESKTRHGFLLALWLGLSCLSSLRTTGRPYIVRVCIMLQAAPDSPYYIRGFPVGFTIKNAESGKNMHFLHNHVRITVRYHEDASLFQGSRIVGFEVCECAMKYEYST